MADFVDRLIEAYGGPEAFIRQWLALMRSENASERFRLASHVTIGALAVAVAERQAKEKRESPAASVAALLERDRGRTIAELRMLIREGVLSLDSIDPPPQG